MSQMVFTEDGLQALVDQIKARQLAEEGKGLSTNDFTDDYIPNVAHEDVFLNSKIRSFYGMPTRQDKENLLHQKGVMVWFTGLSGSGKSTIAIALERELHKRGFLCRILDGDNIRSGINNNLGFTETDRIENIRRIAEVGKLFVDTGIITLAAFISPNNEIREMAASIIGKDDFLEIYVSTPITECERRDVKGLYAKARKGEIKNFTGISAPFEAPSHPALSLDTSVLSVEESVNKLLDIILPKISK